MLNKNKRGKLFARRAFILAGFKSALLMALVSRLYYLQIIKSDQYKTFSDSNRIRPFLIPPLRGKILDRNGEYMAVNRNYYRVLFDPQTKTNGLQTVKYLASLLKLDDDARDQMISKFKNHRSRRPLILYEHASWEEVAKVEVHSPDLPGVSINMGQIRYFEMEDNTPHIIGYLSAATDEEVKTNILLNHPDFKIGRSGIEKAYDASLRGKAGLRHMEVDAFGLSVRELSKEESIAGDDLKLAIDKRLHQFITQRMEGNSGSVVVMDVDSGELVAMTSTPGFDPNRFTYGVSSGYWNQLLKNPNKPLIDKTIANQYPPGSTYKAVVALAALKEGIDPNQKIFCPGFVDLGRRRFRCWKEEGHGNMNLKEALMHSCNTYFYTIAKKIGHEPIAEMSYLFGLGEPLDIGLPNEKAGIVPTDAWKRKRFNDSWQSGDTLNLGIGQGFLLATPLQLAVMTARLAKGKNVIPHLTPNNQEEKIFESLNIPKRHLDIIHKGLYNVVNVPGGTAYGSRIKDKRFSMAGKTGTAQVISKKALEAIEHTLSDEQRKRKENHALFVGYGPTESPRYAICVIIEHGGGGSKAAAPVARDVMQLAQELELERSSNVI